MGHGAALVFRMHVQPQAELGGRPVQPLPRCAGRLSGPLLDRIDITYGVVSRHVEVPRVPFQKLSSIASTTSARGEPSAANDSRPTIGGSREHVEAARARQSARFPNTKEARGQPDHQCGYGSDPGAAITARWTRPAATPKVLGTAMQRPGQAMNLNARACHRVLKLARTSTDLAGSERIQPAHIAMSISDRPRSTCGRPRRR